MEYNRKRYRFDQSIQQELIPLRELDNWHCIIGTLYDYAIIAIAILLFYLQPWCYLLSVILIGSRQRALATLLHEAAHLCLAKHRHLNRFVGTYLSGYLILQEFDTYRDSHVKLHHAYLGDPSKDPDYQYHIQQKLYNYTGSLGFFRRYILKPLFLCQSGSYCYYLIKHRLIPKRKHLKNFLEMLVLWCVIIAVCYYFDVLNYLLLLWFIPLVSTSVVFGWFNELAEHYPMIRINNNELYMSRNRFSHWLEHFLFNTHNENYHLVHHLQASMPYWNLKKAHQIMRHDQQYAKWNENMGGIFASSNNQLSLVKRFLMNPVVNKQGDIQYE
ncbi:MAG: hypothetical protein A3F42_05170 [Gammaproteobacteria bacterium RIFCSPHIGHO2_12_FULL_37_34]|nr:MAG: hypothetical protein A3F42_05170 [Gammaproteobacteria bacterium RIFCSPHIGHO2_12_FULL_37_34]